jgi:hypothetical protein
MHPTPMHPTPMSGLHDGLAVDTACMGGRLTPQSTDGGDEGDAADGGDEAEAACRSFFIAME